MEVPCSHWEITEYGRWPVLGGLQSIVFMSNRSSVNQHPDRSMANVRNALFKDDKLMTFYFVSVREHVTLVIRTLNPTHPNLFLWHKVKAKTHWSNHFWKFYWPYIRLVQQNATFTIMLPGGGCLFFTVLQFPISSNRIQKFRWATEYHSNSSSQTEYCSRLEVIEQHQKSNGLGRKRTKVERSTFPLLCYLKLNICLTK